MSSLLNGSEKSPILELNHEILSGSANHALAFNCRGSHYMFSQSTICHLETPGPRRMIFVVAFSGLVRSVTQNSRINCAPEWRQRITRLKLSKSQPICSNLN